MACEGRKTEYNYFSTLHSNLKATQRPAIITIAGKGRTAGDVVKQAIRRREGDQRDGRFDRALGDRVYTVLDVEPHDPTKAQPLREALRLAQQEGVRVLLSNPSFEVWLLCHVLEASELKRAFNAPADADALLKDRLGSNKAELNTQQYRRLAAKAGKAVAVARELHQQHHRNCDDVRDANACTEVYRLVEYLLGQTDEAP